MFVVVTAAAVVVVVVVVVVNNSWDSFFGQFSGTSRLSLSL